MLPCQSWVGALTRGGGSNFSVSAAPRDRYRRLPSDAPLIKLRWPASLVGLVMRAYTNITQMHDNPLAMQVIDYGDQSAVYSFLTALYADEKVPSAFAGIVTVGDVTGQHFDLFQLSWGKPPERPPEPELTSTLPWGTSLASQTAVVASAPDPDEFFFIGADSHFAFDDAGTLKISGPRQLELQGIYTEPLPGSFEAVTPQRPWNWLFIARAGPSAPSAREKEVGATLTRRVLAEWSSGS